MPVFPVFVSSTFRDFHPERDTLHRVIRPRVDAALARYGASIALVDLRWGISLDADDSERQRARSILTICAREIDRCAPLILGLVGDYYGWTPEPRYVRRFLPSVSAGDQERSITDLELRYAMLDTATAPLVFHRRSGTPVVDPRIDDLLGHLRRHAVVHDYESVTDPSGSPDLSQFIELAASTIIERVLAQLGSAGNDRRLLSARSRLAGRDQEHRALQAAVTGSPGRVVVSGASGIGKSALVSSVVDALPEREWRVVRHRVTPSVPSALDLVATIARTLGEPVPTGDALDGMRSLTPALRQAGRVLVVVDSAEHFAAGPEHDRLRLLLRMTPGVAVVVTTTDAAQQETLTRGGFESLALGLIPPESVRTAVTSTLAEHGRALPASAVDAISSAARSGLWLRLVTDLLLALGEEVYVRAAAHADPDAGLAAELVRVVGDLPTDTTELVEYLLQQAEEWHGAAEVERLLTMMLASPHGSIEIDRLAEASGLSAATISRLRYSLSSSIIDLGTRSTATVMHEVVASAVGRRYHRGLAVAHDDLREFHRHRAGTDASSTAALVHHSLHSSRWQDALTGIQLAATNEISTTVPTATTKDVVIAYMTLASSTDLDGWYAAIAACDSLAAVRQLVAIASEIDARRLPADRHLRLCRAVSDAPAITVSREDLGDTTPVILGLATAEMALRVGDDQLATSEAEAVARLAGRQRRAHPGPGNEARVASGLLLYLRSFLDWFGVSMHTTNCSASADVLDRLETHVRAYEGEGASELLADVLATRLQVFGRCRTNLKLGTPTKVFEELVRIRRRAVDARNDEDTTAALAEALLSSEDAFVLERDRLEHLAEAQQLWEELVRIDSGSARYALALARTHRARARALANVSRDDEMRESLAAAAALARSLVATDLRTAQELEAAIAVLSETGALYLEHRRTERSLWDADVDSAIASIEAALDLAEEPTVPGSLQVAAGRKICAWFPTTLDRVGHDLRFASSALLRARYGVKGWRSLEQIASQRNRLLAVWIRAAELTGQPDADMEGYGMLTTHRDIEQAGRAMLKG